MNQIGQSLLPIAPATKAPGGPEAVGTKPRESEGSFDSLLQQQCSELPEEVGADFAVAASEVEPTKSDNSEDASEAPASAGLIAMFGLPAIVPLPAPIQTPLLDDAIADPFAEGGAKEVSTASSNATAPVSSEPTDFGAPVPFPMTPPKAVSAKMREVATLPKALGTSLPEQVKPTLHVADVRGIFPPVITDEPAGQNTPPSIAGISKGTAPAITGEAAGSSEPAIPAVTPEIAPATLSEKTEQPVAASKTLTTQTPVSNAATGAAQISEESAAISTTENFTGMVAAKPGHAMSAPTLTRSPNPTAATSTEIPGNEAASMVTSFGESQSLRNAPVLSAKNARERSTNDHSETTEYSLTSTLAFQATTFSSEPLRANETNTFVQPADVAEVVNHMLAATERLRASGQERVEIALRLDNGLELTIQLRLAKGQVTPVIRTESEPLRLALEQNWSQFFQRSGDRDLQVTKPVFESPQTSSNMTDLNQQRDGRQRAFQELSSSFAQQYLPRRAAMPAPSQSISTTSIPQAGVRLYA